MSRPLTAGDIRRALHNVLRRPVDRSYPLPPYETAADWGNRCLESLDRGAARGLLSERDAHGDSLGKTLYRLSSHELAPSIEQVPGKVRLVGGLIRNIVEPGRINQGHKGTCAVTSIESYLAERQPAEYARLVAGLMYPDGEVLLANGDRMRRDEASLVWSRAEAYRSPVSRVFQAAAMEYAYPDLDYRNTVDGHFRHATSSVDATINTGTGLDLQAFDRLLEAITGTEWETLSHKSDQVARVLARLGLDTANQPNLERDGWGIITRVLAADEAAFVTLDTKLPDDVIEGDEDAALYSLPHKIRVLAFDEQADRVVYEDPLDPVEAWIPGIESRVEDTFGRCSMSRDNFLSLLVELSVKPPFVRGESD